MRHISGSQNTKLRGKPESALFGLRREAVLVGKKRFPKFRDSNGRLVVVHVTPDGVIVFTSQSGRRRQIALAGVWEALHAPESFLHAVKQCHDAARRLNDASQSTFSDIEKTFVLGEVKAEVGKGSAA